MRVLAFPLRLDGDGAFATVEQWSDIQAQQTAVHIVSTPTGERDLAPDFGIRGLIDDGLTDAEVIDAIDLCEPDLDVLAVETRLNNHRQSVTVAVAWRDDNDLGDF